MTEAVFTFKELSIKGSPTQTGEYCRGDGKMFTSNYEPAVLIKFGVVKSASEDDGDDGKILKTFTALPVPVPHTSLCGSIFYGDQK